MNNPLTKDELDVLYDDLFAGKPIKEALQDLQSHIMTGYSYDELLEAVKKGDDLVDEEEVESVDRSVRLYLHAFKYYVGKREREGGIKALEWAYYKRKINPDDDGEVARLLKEKIAQLKEISNEEKS